jgi:hypothetical protein
MADVYVRSGAGGAADGTTWANAYTTLAAAQTGGAFATTNTIWLADDHAESTAGAVAYTGPTTPGLRILGANTHTVEPPTGVATSPSATLTRTTTGVPTFTGHIYMEGWIIIAGSGTSSATLGLGDATTFNLSLNNMHLRLGGTGTNGRIRFGAGGSSANKGAQLRIKNTTVKFAHASHRIRAGAGLIQINGLVIDGSGTVTQTSLIDLATDTQFIAQFDNCDLTALSSMTELVDSTNDGIIDILCRRCIFPDSMTDILNTYTAGMRGRAHDCSSTWSLGASYFLDYDVQGNSSALSLASNSKIVTSTSTIYAYLTAGSVLESGANYAVKPTCTVGGWSGVYRSEPISRYYPGTDAEIAAFSAGASKTITLEYLHDTNVAQGQGAGTGSAFQNNEVWIEVDYLGSSSTKLGSSATSGVTYSTDTPSDNASGVGTGSWTSSGVTTKKSGKCVATITPQQNGAISVHVCMRGVGKVVFYEPNFTIS